LSSTKTELAVINIEEWSYY